MVDMSYIYNAVTYGIKHTLVLTFGNWFSDGCVLHSGSILSTVVHLGIS